MQWTVHKNCSGMPISEPAVIESPRSFTSQLEKPKLHQLIHSMPLNTKGTAGYRQGPAVETARSQKAMWGKTGYLGQGYRGTWDGCGAARIDGVADKVC